MIDEIERRRAQVFQRDSSLEAAGILELMQHIGSDPIIPEQNVANAGDQYAFHKTFTSAMCFPSGSKVWQAHAMQGSNE